MLEKERWETCLGATPLVKGDYIFVYVPFGNDVVYKMACCLAKSLRMRVVVSTYSLRYRVFYPSFHLELAVGPWEFLNLLKNARLVCSGSYHAVIFSVLFQVPFFAVRGMQDNRMREVLKRFHLEERSIDMESVERKSMDAFNMDFGMATQELNIAREKSMCFLKRALSENSYAGDM